MTTVFSAAFSAVWEGWEWGKGEDYEPVFTHKRNCLCVLYATAVHVSPKCFLNKHNFFKILHVLSCFISKLPFHLFIFKIMLHFKIL